MDQQTFNNLIKTQELISPGDTVITAVSGGADSTALFSLLCNLDIDITLICVYVDHGLRPLEIPKEIEFVRQLALSAEKEFICHRVDTEQYKKEKKLSTEEAARKLRYGALQETAVKYPLSVIAVGHTADDQAEEILFRLLRGSSLKGLSGMSLRRDNIIRPLLQTYKHELVAYLKRERLSFCQDSSNSDLTFTRNKIRHKLIPFLQEKFNPTVKNTLNQVVDILSEDNSCLDAFTDEAISSCVINEKNSDIGGEIQLDRSSFLGLHTSIQRRVIEKIILQCEILPTYSNIFKICKMVDTGLIGKQIHLQSGVRFYLSQNTLHFTRLPSMNNPRASLSNELIEEIIIPAIGQYSMESLGKKLTLTVDATSVQHELVALEINYSKITFPLILRQPRAGEKFTPAGMKGRKKVSRFLSDAKIDRFKRQHHPVLTQDDIIIAIMGLRVDQNFSLQKTEDIPLYLYWESE